MVVASPRTQTRYDDLREGQAVTFDVGQGPKAPAAKTFVSRSLLSLTLRSFPQLR